MPAHGIITRTVIPATPVRIEYHLTEKGRALGSVVQAASAWADRWLACEAKSGLSRDDPLPFLRGTLTSAVRRRLPRRRTRT